MRVDDWKTKLSAEVDAAQGRAFEWGEHDCCQFVARCAAAVSGDDRRVVFPEYSTEEGALNIVGQFGGLHELLCYAFGDPKPVARAVKGDIVLCDMGRGPQPAVCLGVWCVAPGARSLEKRMTDTATAAWSV